MITTVSVAFWILTAVLVGIGWYGHRKQDERAFAILAVFFLGIAGWFIIRAIVRLVS